MSSLLGVGRPATGRGSSRHPRESSASLKLFDPAQVQTFKEAFSMIDSDSDGYITRSDLSTLLTSLGQAPSDSMITQLMTSATNSAGLGDGKKDGINFTMFVTMMAEHLSPLDPTTDLTDAFSSFDPTHCGIIRGRDLDQLRKCLREEGDRMSNEEIDRLLKGPFTDRDGSFRYRDLCQTLRVTDDRDDE